MDLESGGGGGGGVREPPEDDGAVGAAAEEAAAVGAQLDAGDAAAVSPPHVGDRALHVVPHLHQAVVSSCDNKRGRNEELTAQPRGKLGCPYR